MSWIEPLGAFFQEIQAPLSLVLDAEGCREGWIQGELFRHFRPNDASFNVNCSHTSKQVKHDIVCGNPASLIAELKVYGLRGYYPKNLYGRNDLSQFQPSRDGARILLTLDTLAALQPEPRSYLGDVLRLSQVVDVPERLMILVIQKTATEDRFGRAILAVQVSRREHNFDFGQFLVRISEM